MRIATIGRGTVGGGLGRFWEQAGHEVQPIGQEGGDASGADAVLLAVPPDAIGDALGKVAGLEGKTVIDATNLVRGERPDGFDSLAAYVKQQSGGNVTKAFNTLFARLYDQIGAARARPGCLFCGDEEAKPTTAQLISDAGYEPVDAGGLENARSLEEFIKLLFANPGGPVFYRVAPPGEL